MTLLNASQKEAIWWVTVDMFIIDVTLVFGHSQPLGRVKLPLPPSIPGVWHGHYLTCVWMSPLGSLLWLSLFLVDNIWPDRVGAVGARVPSPVSAVWASVHSAAAVSGSPALLGPARGGAEFCQIDAWVFKCLNTDSRPLSPGPQCLQLNA